MLDIKFIRDHADLIKETAAKKNISVDITRLLMLDDQRREITLKIEELRAEKNQFSKKFPTLAPEEKSRALEEMKSVDITEDRLNEDLNAVKAGFQELMYKVPMPVDPRTPVGIDDNSNIEMERWGVPRKFNFKAKDHTALGIDLDIIDFDSAGKIGGSRSYILKGDGARLEAGLLKYAEDFICRKGFTLLSVPVIVNKPALYGTGHFPGAEEETYYLERDDKYLVGTSEVSIASLHADQIIDETKLPLRYAAFSVCFRREAGSYGRDTHGLYRVHQFMKVEQFIISKNDDDESRKLHEELLDNSKDLLQSLNMPYRVLNVCTGDMGQGKYYMNDIESWMPSRDNYGETHSCSTLHDFQSRRLNIRYRQRDGQIKFCHTLNNTVVATPRILVPLLENNQNEDGSITIPEVLRPYMDNQQEIKKKE